jgi:organic radical activating enzyme
MAFKWKVTPIQGRQLRDVRQEDLFGDFRLCETYRGGGGYDRFPKIYKKRTSSAIEEADISKQFVVQLYGCPLDCPYCYVTRDGVFGHYIEYSTDEIIKAFEASNTKVFHLMGGAPGLYVENWWQIVEQLPDYAIFHSDLLLVEKYYKKEWFERICKSNVLLAVDIKGVTSEDFLRNTRRHLDWGQLIHNMEIVVESGISFYITFTNPIDQLDLNIFKWTFESLFGKKVLNDSYVIDLVEYEALKGETYEVSQMR